MKLSCQEHLVPGITFEDKIRWLEQHDFDGIEVWGFQLEDRIQEISACLRTTRIEISAICGGYNGQLFSSKPSELDTAIRDIKHLITLSFKLNTPGLILVPYFGRTNYAGVLTPHEETTLEMLEGFVENMRKIVMFAEKYGVPLYIEPINRYESPVFNRISDIATICSFLNSDFLGIVADTFHMNIEENDMVERLQEAGGRLRYVHLADSNRLYPGLGNFKFDQIVNTLSNDLQYSGFLSLECCTTRDQTETDLIEAKNYLKNLIKKYGSSYVTQI